MSYRITLRHAVVHLAMVGLLSAGIAVSAGAVPPGENGDLVVAFEGTGGIATVDSDGNTDTIATGRFGSVDVSPDGTEVLAVQLASEQALTGQLVAIDLETGTKSPVPGVGNVNGAVWSGPAGRIAYTTGDSELFVHTNGASTRVSGSYGRVLAGSAVDDRVIVDRSEQTPSGFPNYWVYTVDVVTGDAVELANNGPGHFTYYWSHADFAPDGSQILERSNTPGFPSVRILDGKDIESGVSPDGSGPSSGAAFSPDGENVAYGAHTSGDPVIRLYALDSGAFSDVPLGTMARDVDWIPIVEPEPPAKSFEDVPEDHLFYNDIQWLIAEGITYGCNPPANTLFCPAETVTRGEMAAFLVRGLDLTDDGGGDLFTDDDDSTFEADIDRLATAGITRGCNPPENTEFCPNDPVTRGEMAAFLVRGLELTDDGGGDLFTDDDDSTFEADIDRLATAGITRGCNPPENTEFCPNDPVTREQMAAFLHRALLNR